MVAVGLVIMVLFLGFGIFMGLMVYRTLQKTDPRQADSSLSKEIETAQEFLPFEDIADDMILLGGHQYRAVIECNSTSYDLKTEKEKEAIELTFQRFINSIKFPITFFVQTRTMNNNKILQALKEEVAETVKEYPLMKEYGQVFYSEMENLSTSIKNNRQKKKYIIVPYDEGVALEGLSDSEKREHSRKELHSRVQVIMDGLAGTGVKSWKLDTQELIELVYSAYSKDNYAFAEALANGDFNKIVVDGKKNREEELVDDARIDWILYEAQMRIQNELVNKNIPDFLKEEYLDTMKRIEDIREQSGGYFKTEAIEEEVREDV